MIKIKVPVRMVKSLLTVRRILISSGTILTSALIGFLISRVAVTVVMVVA